jgi:regulatory protein
MPADDAVEQALRALRHRERTAGQVDAHLAERGFDEQEREAAIETLARTGLVDDRRFAESRAATLARKGAGDAFIRHDLGAAGVEREIVGEALATLDDEATRARQVVERRGASPRTVRYLVAKGFPADVARTVVAESMADALR